MTLPLRAKPATRAFERLYGAHVGDVYRYALAVTGNQADAEDITQTTFLNAYRALERGEQPMKPRHWLIAIAHNVCRQRFRQLSRQPTEVAYEEDIAEALVPSDETPTAKDIQRALSQLAFNQREALVMRELEGRSYIEIAGLLGLSVAAVETLLFRARRALREQLEGALSCSEAEAALSLQLDRRLGRAEAARLRSHLRACETCRLLARRQRAQQKSLRALALVPIPPGLSTWLGAGAVGTGATGAAATIAGAGAGAGGLGVALAAKVAVATVAAVALGAGGYTAVRHETASHPRLHPVTTRAIAAPRAVEAPAKTAARTSAYGGSGRKAAAGRGHAAPARAATPAVVGRPAAHLTSTKHGARPHPAAKAKAPSERSKHVPAKNKTRVRARPTVSHGTGHQITGAPRGSSCKKGKTTPTATTDTTSTSNTETTTTPSACPTSEPHAKGASNRP